MNRDRIVTAAAVLTIAAITIAVVVLMRDTPMSSEQGAMSGPQEEFERGPNGGRLLRDGDLAVEVTIYESGIPPEFRLYAYRDGQPLPAAQFSATVALTRLGGSVDRFEFTPEAGYLRGHGAVREPHSFDVDVTATFDGRAHAWHYQSHEGRTSIPARVAEAQGIRVEPAGPAVVTDAVELTGTIQTDPGRISQVRVRFPGIVTEVRRTVGELVRQGESLGAVETNESLRSVSIDAPISGLIVDRNVQRGQVTGDDPLFVIADLSEVWAQLDVFGNDLDLIEVGQPVRITTLDGRLIEDTIDWVSPLVAHGSQSVRARVTLPNPDNRLRPGQFVRARVVTAETEVPLAVRRSALQMFRDFDVVFARVGETYEVRMLELGRMDAERAEVLDGLDAGTLYVIENSYLVKADIEKSGATHDH